MWNISDQHNGGLVYISKIGNNCNFRQTCSITVSTKIFRPPATKFPLSQAISYTFLDKHFLLIENMSSEASSSESFILLLFFQRSQNPFFQKSHFSKKSAPFFPLFSPILSTTRFCFAPFYADFVLQNLSNSLYFSHQILHSFTQFIETWFLTLLEARFWPSVPSQILVNSYTNYISTFARNYSQKNAKIRPIML